MAQEKRITLKNDAGEEHEIVPDSRDAFAARRTFELMKWATEGETVRMAYVVAYHAAQRAGVVPAERYSLDTFVVEWAIDAEVEEVERTPTRPAT